MDIFPGIFLADFSDDHISRLRLPPWTSIGIGFNGLALGSGFSVSRPKFPF
jgi:hypothetical protein